MYKRLVAGINNMIMCMCEGMCMPIMCCVNFIKIFPASNIKHSFFVYFTKMYLIHI